MLVLAPLDVVAAPAFMDAMRFAELTPLVILMPYVKLKALANAKRHLPNAIAKRIWQHLSTSVSTHCGKWVWF